MQGGLGGTPLAHLLQTTHHAARVPESRLVCLRACLARWLAWYLVGTVIPNCHHHFPCLCHHLSCVTYCPPQATIVRLKYGLTTKDGTHVNKMTSAKIAEQSGFSKQRISQIYRGALQKLAESQELQVLEALLLPLPEVTHSGPGNAQLRYPSRET